MTKKQANQVCVWFFRGSNNERSNAENIEQMRKCLVFIYSFFFCLAVERLTWKSGRMNCTLCDELEIKQQLNNQTICVLTRIVEGCNTQSWIIHFVLIVASCSLWFKLQCIVSKRQMQNIWHIQNLWRRKRNARPRPKRVQQNIC